MMTLLKDVLSELAGMFVGDARLSVSILTIVAISAAAQSAGSFHPFVTGIILLGGCLLLVTGVVYITAHRHWATRMPRNETAVSHRTGLFRAAESWQRRRRQRTALGELDEHLLDDIGVSKSAAEAESRRLD